MRPPSWLAASQRPSAAVETVNEVVPPGATVALAGVIATVKSGDVTTLRVVMQLFC